MALRYSNWTCNTFVLSSNPVKIKNFCENMGQLYYKEYYAEKVVSVYPCGTQPVYHRNFITVNYYDFL